MMYVAVSLAPTAQKPGGVVMFANKVAASGFDMATRKCWIEWSKKDQVREVFQPVDMVLSATSKKRLNELVCEAADDLEKQS